MKTLRRMLGVTLKDRIRNKDVRRKTTVTSSVVSVIKVNKLSWYGHVLRKSEDEVVRQAWEVPVKGEEQRTSAKEVEWWFAEDWRSLVWRKDAQGPQEMEKYNPGRRPPEEGEKVKAKKKFRVKCESLGI